MKKFLVVATVVIAGTAALSVMGTGQERSASGSSSQIFIHGTPVCVTQRGGGIEAAVGECEAVSGRNPGGRGRFHERNGSPSEPGIVLPPGHPPVGPGSDPSANEVRRTPI